MTYLHPGKLAARRMGLDGHVRYEMGHPASHLVYKAAQFVRFALDDEQDPPVRQVLYEPLDGEIRRNSLHRITEADTLDTTGEVKAPLLS